MDSQQEDKEILSQNCLNVLVFHLLLVAHCTLYFNYTKTAFWSLSKSQSCILIAYLIILNTLQTQTVFLFFLRIYVAIKHNLQYFIFSKYNIFL